jgi:hypothetical protein
MARSPIDRWLAVLLGAICLVAFPSFLVPAAANPAPDGGSIDAYVEQQMREVRIPRLALCIVHDDEVVHLRGFGEAGPDGRAVTGAGAVHSRLGVEVLHCAGNHAVGGVETDLANIGWGLGLLLVFPQVAYPLKPTMLIVPDLGYLVVACGLAALTWGIVRTVLGSFALRRRL